MRIGILILFLIAGLAGGPAASAADDTAATQGSRTAAPDAAKEPAPPPSVTVIGAKDAHGILGREVRSASNNENMGRIVDVIVDRTGQVRAAVIDFGGFLGVGNRKIAVDWDAFNFAGDDKGDVVTLDLTRDQIKAAPEYKDRHAAIVLGAAGAPPTPYH